MIRYRNRSTGKYYAYLATAMDCTPGDHNGATMVVYSPENDPHQIFVIEMDEFHRKYEEAKVGGES